MSRSPSTGSGLRRGSILAKTKDFDIYRYVRGEFAVVRPFGKSTPELLQELRKKVFSDTRNVALDLSSLADPGMPLIREMAQNARRFRNHGRHIVLINVRGRLRTMVRTLAPEELIPFVLTESMLDGTVAAFTARLHASRQILNKIRQELETDPAWKFSDRDGLWLCPYCAETQDHIVLGNQKAPQENAQELIAVHLIEECEAFRKKQPMVPLSDMALRLKKINQEKLMASKESASKLVTRMVKMQDQVNEAAELRQGVEVASQRQRHLLPAAPPDHPDCLFGLGYRPSQRVSGDFYDFVPFPDGRLGIIMGDVSGHGIEAAILMGVSKKVINIRLRDTADPVEAIRRANRDLFDDMDRKTFVTVFLGILDFEKKELVSVRAGHNPTIIYNPAREKNIQCIEPPGMVVGMDSGKRFEMALKADTTTLQSGDLVFLYTDGISEAMNREEEEFGMERINDLLGAHYAQEPSKLIEEIYRELDDFQAGLPQEDDVTMLAFKLS